MRLLISALAAASILGFALASYAAEEGQTVTAPNKPKAAGRAAEKDQTVTAPNKPKPAGRAAEGKQTAGSDSNKPGGVVNEEKK